MEVLPGCPRQCWTRSSLGCTGQCLFTVMAVLRVNVPGEPAQKQAAKQGRGWGLERAANPGVCGETCRGGPKPGGSSQPAHEQNRMPEPLLEAKGGSESVVDLVGFEVMVSVVGTGYKQWWF